MKIVKTTLLSMSLALGALSLFSCDKIDLENPVPTVACCSIDNEAPSAGEKITFDGSCSSTDVDSYEWDFGDETKSTGKTATHTYAAPGEYTVILKVTGGGPAETAKTISVK